MSDNIAPRRTLILKAIEEADHALQLREIVERTGLDYDNARSALSEMVGLGLLVRVGRGIYELPDRIDGLDTPPGTTTRQILNALLRITVTNNALTEALFAGQQELLRAIRSLSAGGISEDVLKNLDTVFKDRVDAHFATATRQILDQYHLLTSDIQQTLTEPLAHPAHPQPGPNPGRSKRSGLRNSGKQPVSGNT